MIADLHIHSYYSDGVLAPKDVIERAAKKGIGVIALTDHDSVDGLYEATLAGEQRGIKVICGVELSTIYCDEPIHLLGYFKSSFPQSMLDFLEQQRQFRNERAKKIVLKLEEHFAIKIDYDELLKKYPRLIARTHIAQAIIDKGYSYTKKQIFSTMIGVGCKAYVPGTGLETSKGIKLLKEWGALVVLAHPVLIKKTKLSTFLKMGIMGIEAIYPANRGVEESCFIDFAKKNNLVITAGSDFHGFLDSSHGDMGAVYLSNQLLDEFLEKLYN